MIIIALKNTQINDQNRHRRSKGRRGGGAGRFLALHVIFLVLFACFFSRVFLLAFILQPLPVVRKFFLRGIYMDQTFFPFPVLR